MEQLLSVDPGIELLGLGLGFRVRVRVRRNLSPGIEQWVRVRVRVTSIDY